MKITVTVCVLLAAIAPSGIAQDFHRYSFEGMGGVSLPTGSAADRLNTGFNFLIGGGWNFNSSLSGMLEFQYDHFSLTTGSLAAFNQPAGYNRFWSITANPRYYFRPRGDFGGYATAGYGIYARTLAFTDPYAAQSYCDPYYGCYSSGAPVIASESNYKGGFNIGAGFTYAIGGGDFRIVADSRYNHFLSHANNSFVTISFGVLF